MNKRARIESSKLTRLTNSGFNQAYLKKKEMQTKFPLDKLWLQNGQPPHLSSTSKQSKKKILLNNPL